jgi:hypothetical protein
MTRTKYMSPMLRTYGTVDALTQVFGTRPTKDVLIINGVEQDVDGCGTLNIP